MARAAEARENFATLTIENLHLFVATIGHIHVSLFAVRRKCDPPSGPPIIGKAASSFNPDIFFEVSQFIEYLDSITLPVANVYEFVVPKSYAVHDLHKRTTNTRIRVLFCALMPPLPEEFSIPVDNCDTTVAISVGNEDIAIFRIDGDIGRHIELRVAGVHGPSSESAVRGIHNAPLADLHHQLSVVAVFLKDSVAVAGSPEIVFVVDYAAVSRVRHRFPVAEAVHDFAIGIELDERRGLPGDVSLLGRYVVPIDDKHVILVVHADAAYLAGDPILGQRFRPGGIYLELWRAALRQHLAKGSEQDKEAETQRYLLSKSHLVIPSNS